MYMLSRNIIESEIFECMNELKSLGIYFHSASAQTNQPNAEWVNIRNNVNTLRSTSSGLPGKVKQFGDLLEKGFSGQQKIAFTYLDRQIINTHFQFDEMHAFIEKCDFNDASSCLETKRRLGIRANAVLTIYNGFSDFISELKRLFADVSNDNPLANPQYTAEDFTEATRKFWEDVRDNALKYEEKLTMAKQVMINIESEIALILRYSHSLK